MSDIEDRVRKIVVEHLGVEEDKVVASASFIDDLGADSLDTVELVMAFEEEFGIEIPDDAAESIQTFGDAVKFISEKSAQPDRVRLGSAAPGPAGSRVFICKPAAGLGMTRAGGQYPERCAAGTDERTRSQRCAELS